MIPSCSSPFESSVHKAIGERHFQTLVSDERQSTEVVRWLEEVQRIGIDEGVVLRILNEKVDNTYSENLDLIIKNRQNGGRVVESDDNGDPQGRSLRQCIQEGALDDVNLYLTEGDKFQISLELEKSCKETPLTLASTLGYCEIVKSLLNSSHSSHINECNRFGQTALHCAAKQDGHLHCVKVLLDFGADLYAKDRYGNLPLHHAAKENDAQILDLLSRQIFENVDNVLRGVWVYGESSEGFTSVRKMTPMFHKVMQQHKCAHFCAYHVDEVVGKVCKMIESKIGKDSVSLPKPSKAIMHHVIFHMYAKELSGFWSKKGDDFVWIETISSPRLLSNIIHHCFHFAAMNPTNNLRSTPLHLACQENVNDSHINVIACLAQKHYCLFSLEDIRGMSAFDHIHKSNMVVESNSNAVDFLRTRANQYWHEKEQLDNSRAHQRFEMLLRWCIDEMNRSNCEDFRSNEVSEEYKENNIDWDLYKNDGEHLEKKLEIDSRVEYLLRHHTLSPFPDNDQKMSVIEERTNQAWRFLLNLSVFESEYSLRGGTVWLKYCHQNTGEIFYYCADKGMFSLKTPSDGITDTTPRFCSKSIEGGDPDAVGRNLHVDALSDFTSNVNNEHDSPKHFWPKLSTKNVRHCKEDSLARFKRNYYPCQWGCGCLVSIGRHQSIHEKQICSRRILRCSLGCSKLLPEYLWFEKSENSIFDTLQWHQQHDCPKRQVYCSFCEQQVQCDKLSDHKSELCPKRPASNECKCELGCGEAFCRTTVIKMHKDREEHEQYFCVYRLVNCQWKGCNSRLKDIDMAIHVKSHIRRNGIKRFDKPGTHQYKFPKNSTSLLIRLWGAGGGGSINERGNGSGGGGAFVEIHVDISTLASEELTIYVGEGGPCGKLKATKEGMKPYGIRTGHSLGSKWLGGYGGEHSAVFRSKGQNRDEAKIPLLVAGGGGGAGTKDGDPGRGVDTVSSPNDLMGSHGGGGGIFSSPGISRGGVGGRSYIDRAFVGQFVSFQGNGRQPGAGNTERMIPVQNTANMDGIDLKHGEGGNTAEGACGCVEIGLAQYFFDTDVCHKDCH